MRYTIEDIRKYMNEANYREEQQYKRIRNWVVGIVSGLGVLITGLMFVLPKYNVL